MRDRYDCLILGNDPTACLLAIRLATQGVSVALSPEPFSHQDDYWLLPTWGPQLEPLHQLGLAGERLDRLTRREHRVERIHSPHSLGNPAPLAMRLVAIADVFQQASAMAQARGVEFIAARQRHEISATLTIRSQQHFEQKSNLTSPVISGLYRHVCREPGTQEGTAFWYSSETGAELWIVPIDAELTSVGGSFHHLNQREIECPEFWEEQLVACPALVDRLFDAELVGSLQTRHYNERHSETKSLTAYSPFNRNSVIDLPWQSLTQADELTMSIVASLQTVPIL